MPRSTLRDKLHRLRDNLPLNSEAPHELLSESERELLAKRCELHRAMMGTLTTTAIKAEARNIVKERVYAEVREKCERDGFNEIDAKREGERVSVAVSRRCAKKNWLKRYLNSRRARLIKREKPMEVSRKLTTEVLNALKDLRLKAQVLAKHDILVALREGHEVFQDGLRWRLHDKHFVHLGAEDDPQPETLVEVKTDEDGNEVRRTVLLRIILLIQSLVPRGYSDRATSSWTTDESSVVSRREAHPALSPRPGDRGLRRHAECAVIRAFMGARI